MKPAMRFVIGVAVAGVLLALMSPWIHQAVAVARLIDAGGAVFPPAHGLTMQTAVGAGAPASADLSAPSLMLRPRHMH